MYLLTFYVPEDHLEIVKEHIFATGAGKMGDYAACAWQTLGQGQFHPLSGSNPFIGKQNELTTIPELKVEIICLNENINAAVSALKKSHPYETPSYHVVRCEDI